MRLLLFFLLAGWIGIHHAPAQAQDTTHLVSGDPLRGPDVPFQRVKYGPDWHQVIRFNLPRKGRGSPLVVLVGDGGWRGGVDTYPMHLLRSALFEDGYAFAAIEYTDEYRSGRAEVMLDNIVAAFEKLAADADGLGFDPHRIVLLGNGPGGHFVTLLGTDPTLLAGTPFFSSIRGVVSVNGHGFDIAKQIAEATPIRAEAFRKAFGSDPAVHARLSPVTHLAPPNAPAFLFQAVADHPHIQNQAMGMYRLLKRAGAKSAYAPLPPWRWGKSRTYYGWDGGDGYLHLSQFLLAVVTEN